MEWHRGLKRLRVVGSIALAIGVVFCASVQITRGLGYAPDDAFASAFGAMWPVGLALALLGGLLWVAVWVLQGFAPAPGAPRPAHPEE
jgi:hypothetical protein